MQSERPHTPNLQGRVARFQDLEWLS
jgi:hypothetical protein